MPRGNRLHEVAGMYDGWMVQADAHVRELCRMHRWYQCPEFGYDFKQCLACDGPKVRCVSHYSLLFRCVWNHADPSSACMPIAL